MPFRETNPPLHFAIGGAGTRCFCTGGAGAEVGVVIDAVAVTTLRWHGMGSAKRGGRLTRSAMKIFLNLCSAASLVYLVTIAAGDFGFTAAVPVVGNSDAGLPRKTVGPPATKGAFAAPVVFNAHVRSKVVQYFDTYRSAPFGLPPGCAVRVDDQMPMGWENPGIASGRVIPDSDRAFLMGVPIELVRMLATHSKTEVRYYLAGRSLVAVDSSYKVLDTVGIPTVRMGDERELARTSRPLVMVRHLK